MRWKLEHNGEIIKNKKQQKRHYTNRVCNTQPWNNKCNGVQCGVGYLTHHKDTTVNPVRKQSDISITAHIKQCRERDTTVS